ncbi:hypothetical protein [Actinoplanes rectilineatus]|uniref:hypothetical protein n=1 Tax=Actinoplanes rectilineatus TaxID=113571 RepID=UPI000696C7F1|nr:hypothetical protein [Actinoplanes rectilineatus]
MDHEPHGHDLGLAHDLPLLRRRGLLGLAGGTIAALGLAGPAAASIKAIPEETSGPYPADGSNSNSLNVLDDTGIVRSDIRTNFGSVTGSAAGVPLTIKLKLVTAKTGKARSGLAVYLWHCDRDGNYSMYSEGMTDANYLRGVQATAKTGWLTFRSIFPGCYAGRWPHIHFEVYPSVAKATTYKNKLRTSQIAIPADAASKVYATDAYASSKRNLAQISLKTDNVFKDGWTTETPSITGSVSAGFVATLTVGV